MRDGVELLGDHYEPEGPAVGALLVRGPYGRGLGMSLLLARPFAAHGYHVLLVSCRGTAGSGGQFDPMRTEVEDGQDVVAWLRQQPWFPGTFGTLGGSYLGFTQWALLADPPPELAACVISIGPHDFSRHAWGTGTFNLDLIGWSDGIVANRGSARTGMLRLLTAKRRIRPILNALPIADAAQHYFGDEAPWVRERLVRPDLTDPYWAAMRQDVALDRVDVPVLLVSGWQDLFLVQTMEQYRHLQARGLDVAMTVGPWTHIATSGARAVVRETLDWLDSRLARRSSSRRAAPVRVFVTGAGEWRDLEVWPSPTQTRRLYLHPDAAMRAEPPTMDSGESSLRYDPADPTPTVGGPILSGGGYVDDGKLAVRNDVLAFDGPPLTEDLEVLGQVAVHLTDRTEHPDADLFVRLSDVDERGRSRNVTEGYRRLNGVGPAELRLGDTAHRFRRGHRIRLLLAGGSFPQYARSLGTGGNPVTDAAFVTNRHAIVHGGGASWIELPIYPPK
jgi:putative CocE/NonD family hydrolase